MLIYIFYDLLYAVPFGSRSGTAGESVGDTHSDKVFTSREIDTILGREHISRIHPARFSTYNSRRRGYRQGSLRGEYRTFGAYRSALSRECTSVQLG